MKRLLTSTVLVLGIAGFGAQASAVPITGTPVGNAFGWTPNSTNALNYDKMVPGREGQDAPYVLFDSNAVGQVTLDFHNLAPGLAFFEIRIDGIQTGATAHPVVVGDVIHTGGVPVNSGDSVLNQVFLVTQYVDVRLALGGERDWDFDWVRFEAQQVSAPASLSLFGVGLALLGFVGRKRRRPAAD